MSVIKELYDIAKDGVSLKAKTGAIKRALKTELKLNRKLLLDVEEGIEINGELRLKNALDEVVGKSDYDPAAVFGVTFELRS